jgi:RNA polymerase sigma-70 factor (ECF subfamily)
MTRGEAFVALYEAEAKGVLVFFARRTFDAQVALDLTAETFAQAWRGWSRVRLDSREEVRAWLFTIARRQLGRYYRRGRVEQRALRLLRIRTPSVHQDDTVQIERAAQLGSVRGLIGEGLAALSDEQREALQLRVVDELPYVEVARQLGVSEATARARVSRGLRALSVALEPVLASEGWEL